MRLIDAPIGIFRFDGELVLKTEYYSENKQSGKYIPDCYIVRTGEYFWGGVKTANELINLDVEPVDFAELLSTVTDTISRQDAIDEANAWLLDCLKVNKQDRSCGLIRRLEDLPSAHPKRGKWIDTGGYRAWYAREYRCSKCGGTMLGEANFCPNCGERKETKETK